MLANATAEATGRTLACRLYEMTDDPGMKDALAFLIAEGTSLDGKGTYSLFPNTPLGQEPKWLPDPKPPSRKVSNTLEYLGRQRKRSWAGERVGDVALGC